MRFWGITGTNGKTTTTWIFAEFLNACAGRTCGYLTTVEVNTGTRRFYTGYTTPPLAQLKEIFAEMERNGCTDCVMEVSSHAIHQHRTGDTIFSGGAFTNLSEDHLDYHKTMEAYFDVKLDFARQIAEQWKARATEREMDRATEREMNRATERELDRATEREMNRATEREMNRATERVSEAERAESRAPYVVCLDGGYGREMFNAVGNLPVNVIPATIGTGTFGTDGTAGTCRPDYDLSRLPLAGAYNKSNVLTAAALAEAAGVPHEVIQRVIPTLKPRWGRLELVENQQVAATVYVDFAHTPDGLEKVLTAVRGEMEEGVRHETGDTSGDARRKTHFAIGDERQETGDLWVVFGAGGDRDPMKRPLMGAACAKLADRLVVTSDNPRSEDPMKIIDAILQGVRDFRGRDEGQGERSRSTADGSLISTTVHPHLISPPLPPPLPRPSLYVEPDRAKAIAYALTHARKGDVVVIAGKGHETTQEIKGVKYPFDDRAVVRSFARE